MEYKLYWKPYGGELLDITNRSGSLSVSDDIGTLALQMSVSVLNQGLDHLIAEINVQCGDLLVFTVDTKEFFRGTITEAEYNPLTATYGVTANDYGALLTQNQVIFQARSIAADEAIRKLCAKVGIAAGNIPALKTAITGIFKTSVSEILLDILGRVEAETGRAHLIRVENSALQVKQLDSTVMVAAHQPAENLPLIDVAKHPGEISIKRSIADLKNSVLISSDSETSAVVLAASSDAESIARYGLRQAVESFGDQDTATAGQKAKNTLSTLNAVSNEFSCTLLGSPSVLCGVVLEFAGDSLTGKYRVVAASHDFGTPYTMSLTLKEVQA